MPDNLSKLDYTQVIKRAGVSLDGQTVPSGGLAVTSVGGTLVPESYDEIDLTYVAAGNGLGEIETVTYSKDGSPLATLTLTYDAQNRITNITRS